MPKTLSDLIEFLEDIRDEYPQLADASVCARDEGGIEYVLVGTDAEDGCIWLALEESE